LLKNTWGGIVYLSEEELMRSSSARVYCCPGVGIPVIQVYDSLFVELILTNPLLGLGRELVFVK
jgi:hypothetical protein